MVEFVPGGIGTVISRPTTRTAPKRDTGKKDVRVDIGEFSPPPRPFVNYIPAKEDIQELVQRALNALTRGFYWDRGSIINLLL